MTHKEPDAVDVVIRLLRKEKVRAENIKDQADACIENINDLRDKLTKHQAAMKNKIVIDVESLSSVEVLSSAAFSDNPTDYEKEIVEDTIYLIIKKLKQLEARNDKPE